MLDNNYDCSFATIVSIKEKRTIKECQYFSGFLPAGLKAAKFV